MHSEGIGFTQFSPRNSDSKRSDRKFNPNRDLTWPLIFMCVHSAFTAEIVKKGNTLFRLLWHGVGKLHAIIAETCMNKNDSIGDDNIGDYLIRTILIPTSAATTNMYSNQVHTQHTFCFST